MLALYHLGDGDRSGFAAEPFHAPLLCATCGLPEWVVPVDLTFFGCVRVIDKLDGLVEVVLDVLDALLSFVQALFGLVKRAVGVKRGDHLELLRFNTLDSFPPNHRGVDALKTLP